jgi:tripartite-type tricarboxylate transporter receptor subunit TctC
MKSLSRILVAAGAALLSVAASDHASAQAYPNKPITIIVPFAAGSATDTISRVAGQYLSSALNQTVVVENKPGANGALAALYVARAAPDGHTLFMSTNSPHSAVPFLMKNVPYDVSKDFTAITRMGSYTLMLVVHPSVPATSVKQLIEHAKANPGKLSYASANTSGVVAGATLARWAELDLLHVPYKSSPPAIQDLLAGRVSMMFNDFTTSMPHVQAKTMRPLAVTRIKRSTTFIKARPHLFSNAPVFLSESDTGGMLRIVRAIEAATRLPAYGTTVLSWAPEIARCDFGPRGVFMGYDFHLAADGPKLIEVNTNAGGTFLNACPRRNEPAAAKSRSR